MEDSRLFLGLCVLLILIRQGQCQARNGQIHRPGRHICTSEKIVMAPVRRLQTYCRPYYQKRYLPCPDDNTSICTSFRLTYRTAERSIFHLMPQREQSYSCCPGWTGYSRRYGACMEPVCEKPCEHGGFCHQPGKCFCPQGWDGDCCENDTNECMGDHGCQHICTNTPGGYNCTCHEGFVLQNDLKSCQFCLTCNEEYKSLATKNGQLNVKLRMMESEMGLLNRSFNSITEKVSKLIQSQVYRGTTPSNGDFKEEVLSPELELSLIRLEEKVDKVESALGKCNCESEIYSAQNDVYREFKRMERNFEERLSALEFEQVHPPPLEFVGTKKTTSARSRNKQKPTQRPKKV